MSKKYHKVFSLACYCPVCGGKSMVYSSRTTEDTLGFIRRRECEQCGQRWKTIELMYNEFLEGYKDGKYDE